MKQKKKHRITSLLLLIWLAELLSTFSVVFMQIKLSPLTSMRESQILGFLFQLAAYGVLVLVTRILTIWSLDFYLPYYSLITIFILRLIGIATLYVPAFESFNSWLLVFGGLCFLVTNWLGLFTNYTLYFTLDRHILLSSYHPPIRPLRWCFYVSTLGSLLSYLLYHYSQQSDAIPFYLSTLVQLVAQLAVLIFLASFIFSVYLRENHL